MPDLFGSLKNKIKFAKAGKGQTLGTANNPEKPTVEEKSNNPRKPGDEEKSNNPRKLADGNIPKTTGKSTDEDIPKTAGKSTDEDIPKTAGKSTDEDIPKTAGKSTDRNIPKTSDKLTDENIPKTSFKSTDENKLKTPEKNEGKQKIDHSETKRSNTSQNISYFCEICKSSVSSSELISHIKECSSTVSKTDAYRNNLVLYVFKMTNSPDKFVKTLDLLEKSVFNIINYPNEEKYRKIRLQNKVFLENVVNRHFGVELYLYLGFELSKENNEEFISCDKVQNDHLEELLTTVKSYIPPRKLFSRNAVIYTQKSVKIDHREPEVVPDATDLLKYYEYNRKVREINEMFISQKAKEKLINAINKEDKPVTQIATIRIRFPDLKYLEGIFGVYETIEDVYKFVTEYTSREGHNFVLYKSAVKKIPLQNSRALIKDNDMTPACALVFEWDDSSKCSYLKNI